MILTEKYSTKEEEGKRVISEDAFAVCEFIELLINKIERARISSLMKR